MQKTWILAADNARARIFEVEGVRTNFHEIQDFVNEAGRDYNRDLRTDAKGRFYGKGERDQAHTADPDVDAVRHETELFSKQVGEYLEKGRTEHRYDQLFLIAYPKFLGMLRQSMSEEARQLIKDEIPKDISQLKATEIEDFYLKNRLH
jgi:protein required for attachment to host cells